MPFGEVQRPQLRCSLPSLGVGSEDGSRTFTLRTNYSTHGSKPGKKLYIRRLATMTLATPRSQHHVTHFSWRILTSRCRSRLCLANLLFPRKYRAHLTHGGQSARNCESLSADSSRAWWIKADNPRQRNHPQVPEEPTSNRGKRSRKSAVIGGIQRCFAWMRSQPAKTAFDLNTCLWAITSERSIYILHNISVF